MSRLIGSEVLRGSSECDGCAARKRSTAPRTLPQAVPCIMSIWVRMHRLDARAPIQIASVINQTEKDTMRCNGLCLDGPPQWGPADRSVRDRAIDLCLPAVFR
ncbi:hypothetical protein C2I33_08115 [Ralstonia solanacearum]|nr:hypothetical protein C2I33_08115 [Ralstonia solanacearum]